MTTEAEYEARVSALNWDGLQTLWEAIERRDTPDWEPGRAFEYLVLRAFQLDGAQVRWPYSVRLFEEEVEQIDGAIYHDGLSCLVESKDQAEPVAFGPIAKVRNQLLRRPAGTVGLLFSRSGFTPPAHSLAYFALPQAILLWDGEEIGYILQQKKACDLLLLKYRACVEDGLPDYDVRERGVR